MPRIPKRSAPFVRYNTQLLVEDMAERGWSNVVLAKHAKVSPRIVGHFLQGTHQSPKMAAKLSKALGFEVKRYIISQVKQVA